METVLKYGADSSVALQVASATLIAEFGRPRHPPLDDPAAAVAAALVEPLEYPPLKMAIAPGDRIALALDVGVPCTAELCAGVVATLREAGVAPQNITALRAREETGSLAPNPLRLLPPEVRDLVQLVTHDPTQRDELGYLAASAEGNPIYVNRALCDADVVLPISCVHLESTLDCGGAFGGLFPTFADEATQRRFRAPSNGDSSARRKRRRRGTPQREAPQRGTRQRGTRQRGIQQLKIQQREAQQRERRRREADEAGWWLGVNMAIQVVPGPGESILHVLAGGVHAVYQQGRELCRQVWGYRLPRRASLVVAGIAGDANCQTWENVGRALAAALNVVDDGGAIAVCSQLATEPGAALREIVAGGNLDLAYRAVRRQHSPDAATATRLLRALENHRVFLLSRLASDVVEELGIAPIHDVSEIHRLAQRYPTCTVISNAQYVMTNSADDGTIDDITIDDITVDDITVADITVADVTASAPGIGRQDQ